MLLLLYKFNHAYRKDTPLILMICYQRICAIHWIRPHHPNQFKRMSRLIADPSYWLTSSCWKIGCRMESVSLSIKSEWHSPVRRKRSFVLVKEFHFWAGDCKHGLLEGNRKWWFGSMWSWKLLQKIKCFLWSTFNDKILTWANLRWRAKWIQTCVFFAEITVKL